MEKFRNILHDIELSKAVLNDMIAKAKEQGAKNFEMLFTLKDGLVELEETLLHEKKLNHCFVEKWNAIMGWAPRVFEGHPLLDLLRNIDDALMNTR